MYYARINNNNKEGWYQVEVDSVYRDGHIGTKKIARLDKHVLPISGITYCNGYLLSISKDCTMHIWKKKKWKYECVDVITDSSFANIEIPYMSIDMEGKTILINGSIWTKDDSRTEWVNVFFDSCSFIRDFITDDNMDVAPTPKLANNGTYVYYGLCNNVPSIFVFDHKTRQSRLIGHSLGMAELLVGSPTATDAAGINPINRDITLYHFGNDGVDYTILKGHTNQIYCLNFSPDGRYLVSSSSDSTIRIWNVTTKECVDVLTRTEAPFYDVKFTDDGKSIIAVGKSPVVGSPIAIQWEFLSLQEIMKRCREKISKRILSAEERKQHYLE